MWHRGQRNFSICVLLRETEITKNLEGLETLQVPKKLPTDVLGFQMCLESSVWRSWSQHSWKASVGENQGRKIWFSLINLFIFLNPQWISGPLFCLGQFSCSEPVCAASKYLGRLWPSLHGSSTWCIGCHRHSPFLQHSWFKAWTWYLKK